MNKFLIITGGSSGIGYAAALLFQKENYKVINLSRSKIPLSEAIHVSVDLSTSSWHEEIDSVLKNLLDSADQISLIHNASKMQSDNVEDFNLSELRDVIEVNLVAPAILNKMIIPYMKKGSSIIYVGSTLSEKAVPQMSSYVTTKHAMIGLMRSTCQDLFGRFIHTACVCPGATETEMLQEYVQGNTEALEMMAGTLSENRLITPEEIASTLLFCSQNSVINGSVIHANLGILSP
ncbi:SDR family oxidoreductase [Gammaproteobacteria bacterium]|nr:SDR family oxidoreductase [Gammaproteobacteria bacterium]MDC0129540.1 SDR family oxidoreductase [Gammaproteobacteria bacterium]